MSLPDPAQVEGWVAAVQDLPGLKAQSERLSRLTADYRRGFSSAESALVVALVGATGAGKSTLLNALAGLPIAEEGETRPTSRESTVYAPRDAVLPDFGASRVLRYAVEPGAPWAGQVFIDTPDLNSIEPAHRRRAEASLERADLALVVLHKGSVVEATQAEFLRAFAQRRRLWFVLNYGDQLSAEAREQLKQQVRQIAEQQLGVGAADVRVFAISAREARRGADVTGEFGPLVDALRLLASREVAERIRRSNAVAVLRELSSRIQPARKETDQALADSATALGDASVEAKRAYTDDLGARLDLAAGHLGNAVRAQAASRWWGPSSLWLRLSLTGSGGLTAAALLARRSVPIGLAAGAVMTAVDRLQAHTRAQAAEQRVRATDEDAGLVPVARAALTSARQRLSASGIDPAVALPSVEEVHAEVSELRASALRYVEGTAVSRAVARWWGWARWLLMPLINLPLLALFAHAAYRVVRAYLFGPLLDGAYYLNLAALAVLLAVGGGVLASWTVSGLSRTARAEGKSWFGDQFELLTGQWLSHLRSALLPARKAAQALEQAAADADQTG